MKFFYNLFVHLFPFFIRVTSIWNPKAKLWVSGRKNQFKRLQEAVGASNQPIIWFHSASLGEFEQGRPVIERIKSDYPQYRILLTFFSPSGYEVRKNYAGADMVFYLPMDNKYNAKRFIEITQPKLAIFIKYETWYYYLTALSANQIPVLLISAIFYPHQFSFKPWANFMIKTLNSLAHIFVQSDDGLEILKEHQINTGFSIGGDTRYDRVKTLALQNFEHDGIKQFIGRSKVVVAGSTWAEDEKKLRFLYHHQNEIKLIIAPHETSAKNIEAISNLFLESLLFSDINKTENPSDFKVLIIDSIGLLSKLYRFASITYVGGGFNTSGIHNILEAAAYGKTVVFGPNFFKSNEAKEMIQQNLAYSYSEEKELLNIINDLLDNNTQLEEKNKLAKVFVEERTGATDKIIEYIKQTKQL